LKKVFKTGTVKSAVHAMILEVTLYQSNRMVRWATGNSCDAVSYIYGSVPSNWWFKHCEEDNGFMVSKNRTSLSWTSLGDSVPTG
jgi:hypothetical protein